MLFRSRPAFVVVRFAQPVTAPTVLTYTTVDGTALGVVKPKDPGDYQIRARSITLRTGAMVATIPVNVLPDTVHEGVEQFTLSIDASTGEHTVATVTILDDE